MHVKSKVLSQLDTAASARASSTASDGQGLELVSGGHALPVGYACRLSAAVKSKQRRAL